MAGGRPREWTDELIKELGEKLVKCCEEPNVWHLTHFECKEDLYDGCLEYLCETYPKQFIPFYTQALRLIGNRMMVRAMDGSVDRWVIKTFMPRYLNCRKWIKEDIEMEAQIKAEAIKAANLPECDPRLVEFLSLLKEKTHVKSS